MSQSPSPSAVLAQCVRCGWQGHVDAGQIGYQIVGAQPLPEPLSNRGIALRYLPHVCHACGGTRLIDRSTPAI